MECGVRTILSNVGQLVGEEFRQLRAVGGEVAELRDELATMNALLRMQSEAEDGSVDHFVREWMKQIRELAYDVDDCVHLYLLRIRPRPKDGLLAWSKRLLATLFPRRRLAGDIRALRARAVSISERHARYGISREALRRSPSLALARSAASSGQVLRPASGNDDPAHLVRIENQANILAKRVMAGEPHLKVFSIVGFGGLGKTTLAMEVCRHLEAEFDRQAQVSVSQMFDGGKDLKDLLKRLLRQIVVRRRSAAKVTGNEEEDPLARIDTFDVDQLARTLKDHLQDKRYLIVVDDVWTIAAWNSIHSKLPDNELGSRVIVTTRIETVAKECSNPSVSDYYSYRIIPLKLTYARNLFLSRAFGSIKNAPTHEGLAAIMDNILKKCAGLPLAIVSIASLLAIYKYPERKDIWEMVYKSIGSHMESNPTLEGMGQLLTLSYNHLPYHLKACMMYLSIFPEDYIINKNRLLYRWIAEGLIEEKRGLTLLEVAESYFNELMSRNMIDPASPIVFEGIKEVTCRVHDMMLEVMVSKSLEANFVSLVGGQYEGMLYDRVRRLSIQGVEQEAEDFPSKRKNSIVSMDMQHVRSLSMFGIKENKLFDRLREFNLLRVLDLQGCEGLENKHVVHICQMYLLKFLSLKGTNISVMPQEIGELEHLQVLDVRQTGLTKLPETVSKLEKLELLDLSHTDKWHTMWNLPKGLSKMKALREIGKGLVSNVQTARDIGELGKLQGIYLFVDHEPGILPELILSVGKLHSLRPFSIARMSGGTCRTNLDLDMTSPPRLLRYLCIDGQIEKFPNWVSSLSYLTTFYGIWLRMGEDQLYGVLCKLPSLLSVTLNSECYMDKILVAKTSHNFPVLKTLSVCSAESPLPEEFQFEKGSMDKLEELSVTFVGDQSRSIVGIQHLQNLKEVQLRGRKSNPSLGPAIKQLNEESRLRKAHQFKVVVRYD